MAVRRTGASTGAVKDATKTAAPKIAKSAGIGAAKGGILGTGVLPGLATGAAVGAGAATGIEQLKGAGTLLAGREPTMTEKAALALPTFGLSLVPGIEGVTGEIGSAIGFGQKSTKDIQAERTKALIEQSQLPQVQRELLALRFGLPLPGQAAGAPPRSAEQEALQQERIAAQEAKFGKNAAKDLTQEIPERLWGSEGVLATFGPDYWLKELNEQQRFDITQRLIDEGLFRHDKGDVIINSKDQARARELANEVLAASGGPIKPETFGDAVTPEVQAKLTPDLNIPSPPRATPLPVPAPTGGLAGDTVIATQDPRSLQTTGFLATPGQPLPVAPGTMPILSPEIVARLKSSPLVSNPTFTALAQGNTNGK